MSEQEPIEGAPVRGGATVGAVTAVLSYDEGLIEWVQAHAHVDAATAEKLTQDALTRSLDDLAEAGPYSLELHYEDMLSHDEPASVPAPPVEVALSAWQSQRVRDLLTTLADIDAGEHVALVEIHELVALFPEDPAAVGGERP